MAVPFRALGSSYSVDDYRTLLGQTNAALPRQPLPDAATIMANADNVAARALRVNIARYERQHVEVGLKRAEKEVEMLRNELHAFAEEDGDDDEQVIAEQTRVESQGKDLVDGFDDHIRRQAIHEESFAETMRIKGCPSTSRMRLPDYRLSTYATIPATVNAQHVSDDAT